MHTNWTPAVGDYVHCPHAKADGIVSTVHSWAVTVRVTRTYGALYEVGAEYAWMPMQLQPIADPVLN